MYMALFGLVLFPLPWPTARGQAPRRAVIPVLSGEDFPNTKSIEMGEKHPAVIGHGPIKNNG